MTYADVIDVEMFKDVAQRSACLGTVRIRVRDADGEERCLVPPDVEAPDRAVTAFRSHYARAPGVEVRGAVVFPGPGSNSR